MDKSIMFQMRVSPGLVERLEAYRLVLAKGGEIVSRAEVVRRLLERGLTKPDLN